MNRIHEKYINRCFELARLGYGTVSPNPMVGSVIVKNDNIIAEGFHKKAGSDHAELDAFKNATESVKGATLYCNLEPCCHTNKKTPPCAQRIIQEGITKVVIANLDPNPAVAGMGVKLLRENGIEVVTGILEEIGLELNEIFFTHITQKRPFIHLKMAQTLDGKLATTTMDSKWITNEKSREHVHQIRNGYDAIMVGANTVRLDNPSLTVRIPNQKAKGIYRVIISLSGNFDIDSNVLTDEFKEKTIIISSNSEDNTRFPNFILGKVNSEMKLDLQDILSQLYLSFGITSLYIEGGKETLTSFIKEELFDRISIYIAPKIIGDGHNVFGDLDIKEMKNAINFHSQKVMSFDNDIYFTALRNKKCSQV